MLRKTVLVACLCCPVLPATAEPPCEQRQEAEHLGHEALMVLEPEPNIRPRLDNGGEYAGGGIGVLIYEGVNAMDAMGPYQVFATAGLRPMLISASQQEDGSYKAVVTSNSGARLVAHRTIANTPTLDVLVVTGGAVETAQLATNTTVLRWIRDIHEHTHWTTSVAYRIRCL